MSIPRARERGPSAASPLTRADRRCVRERGGCGCPPHGLRHGPYLSDKREWNREVFFRLSCLRAWEAFYLPYHQLTRANTPGGVSFRRFLIFSPWRAPASLQRNVARQHRRIYADSARLRLKSQKSLENPSLAGAYSFAGAEMCPDKERPAENTCRIVKGLDAVWAHFCPSKPCLPLSTDGKNQSK